VDSLRVYPVRRKKIGGLKIKEFIENCEDSKLYLLDIDAYMGREMNIKVYNELSGIFDMWIDAAPRRVEDVMDLIVLGAQYAVLNDVYMKGKTIMKTLELTENIVLKSYNTGRIEKFIKNGGKIIITSARIASTLNTERTYIFEGREVRAWKN